MSDSPRRIVQCRGLVIFAITCAILYVAQEVIIPMAMAGLLALLLTPTVKALKRRGTSNGVAVAVVMGLLSMVMIGIMWLAVNQVSRVVEEFPKYRENIKARLGALYRSDAAAFAGSVSQLKHEIVDHEAPADAPGDQTPAVKVDTSTIKKVVAPQHEEGSFRVSDYLSMFSSVFHPFALATMVIILSTFMLIQRDDLHDRFLILTGRLSSSSRAPVSANAINEAFDTIGHYLRMQSVSNACMAIVIASGLGVLGVPNAILWGSMAFVLRFIPYLGITFLAVITCLFSFATSSDLSTPFLVLALFAIIELVLGNIIEPVYFGHNTGLSSFAILVAALFWTWLWGISGLFLSIPMTVCWVLIGRNFENFDFLDTLLSNRALLSPEKRLYHRMLIMEPSEFHDAIDQYTGSNNHEEVYDSILVPTLCLAESEFNLGHISRDRLDAIIASIRLCADEIIDGVTSSTKTRDHVIGPVQLQFHDPEQPATLCIPAHDELDGIACTMVGQLLTAHGGNVEQAHVSAPHDVETLVLAKDIKRIFICALGTQSTMRSIAWARIVRHRFPEMIIVIGLLNAQNQRPLRMIKAKVRYRIDVVTSFKDTVLMLAPAREPVSCAVQPA
jgi:predicted PurR-regulated permease PerM